MGGPGLLKLFVFNNTISTREESQHENLLFYHPAAAKLDEQLMDIGMSAALSGLHSQFDDDTGVTAICCDGYGVVWVEPETDYRIGLAYRRDADHCGYNDDADHGKLAWIMERGYATFRLHFGRMDRFSTKSKSEMAELKEHLARFWEGFIASYIKPAFAQGLLPLAHTDGIEYLGIENYYYLTIQSVANQMEEMFAVHTALVLIHDQVLYTGLNAQDTHTLYHYLAKRQKPTGKPLGLDNILQLSHPLARSDDTFSGYLTPTCGALEQKQSGMGKMFGRKSAKEDYSPVVVNLGPFHEGDPAAPLRQHGLVVYQHTKALFAFLATPELLKQQALPEVGGTFFRGLETRLQKFASHFAPAVSRSLVFDHTYQYWYTNKMNLAVKTSLRRKGTDAVDSLRGIECLKRFFDAIPGVKTSWFKNKDSRWVCAVRSGNREFFAVFDGKPLGEANEEMKRMKAVLRCL